MIKDLMQEYDIEIDDIRWYLSSEQAKSFFEYKDNIQELIHYIWSGRLESDLYHMEENYLEQLKISFENNKVDEHRLREIFNEIVLVKEKRNNGWAC